MRTRARKGVRGEKTPDEYNLGGQSPRPHSDGAVSVAQSVPNFLESCIIDNLTIDIPYTETDQHLWVLFRPLMEDSCLHCFRLMLI